MILHHNYGTYECNFWHVYRSLHALMNNYRILTQNITKCQKWVKNVKKGLKIPGSWKHMIIHHKYGTYECIFCYVYRILHALMKIYRNLTQNITKGQIRVKMDKKEVKIPGIWKTMISRPNYGMYECNFWHFYTIFTCAYDNR